MPEERRDPTIVRKLWMPLFVVCGLSAVVAAPLVIAKRAVSHADLIVIGVVIAAEIVGCWLVSYLALHKYRCPKCCVRLNRMANDRAHINQYRYHCAQCDIVWDTGIKSGGSSSSS